MFYERIYYRNSDIKNQLLGLKTGGTAIYKNTGLVVCENKTGWRVREGRQNN